MLLGYFWTLGTMAVPVLAWAGLEEQSSWRMFVFFCSIPCIFATVLAMLWVPESPRWLVSRRKHEKALEILRQAAVTNGNDPMEIFPDGTVLVDMNTADEVDSVLQLLTPEWRRMTLLLWGIWVGLAFLYWGTIQVVCTAQHSFAELLVQSVY